MESLACCNEGATPCAVKHWQPGGLQVPVLLLAAHCTHHHSPSICWCGEKITTVVAQPHQAARNIVGAIPDAIAPFCPLNLV